MNDAQIRLVLKKTALASHIQDPETVVIDELGLQHGATRVDVAVVNGLLHGYEIKSDHDNLLRLPQQAAHYSAVLDLATLIAAPRHITAAREIVPEWWGIQVPRTTVRGRTTFDVLQEAQPNPKVDALSLAKLLWRQEALELLEELGASKGYLSKPRLVLYARLADVADIHILRERVRRQLKCRIRSEFGVGHR